MDQLKALEVFVAVADAGSLAGAARSLSVSPPSVTRLLGELETELGVLLFHRTTRAVTLTDTGRSFLQDARRIIQDYTESVDAARGAGRSPKGVLRITAPVMFGQHYIAPIILEYLDAYPDVSVDATFIDRVVNVVDEGFDIAVRIGALSDSSLMASRVGEVRRVICGCGGYFETHGLPQKPEDLTEHRIIHARPVAPSNEWRFKDGVVVKVKPRLWVNTVPAAIIAAKASWGLTRVLSYQIGPDLGAGGLKTVLSDFEPQPLPIHIVHPEGRAASAKVRSFVDLATERLRQSPYLNR